MERKLGDAPAGTTAMAGDRDQTFGVGGVVSIPVPGYDGSQGRCVAMRDDDQILVGTSVDYSQPTAGSLLMNFAVTCLNAVAGDLDQNFAIAGHMSGWFSAANVHILRGFCLLDDGQILVYGDTRWAKPELQTGELASFALLQKDGRPNRGWGINGMRAVDLQGWVMARAWPFPVKDGGGALRLIGAAYGENNGGTGLIVHLKADGWLDTSINGTGVVPFPFPGVHEPNVLRGIDDCVMDDDGLFIVAGTPSSFGLVQKIDNSGALVESFGDNGRVFILPPDPNLDVTRVTKVVALSGKRVFCSGLMNVASAGNVVMLAVLAADGSYDPDFNGGRLLLLDTLPHVRLTHAAVDGSGRYVVAGEVGEDGAVVARILPSGLLDPSFGAGTGYIQDHLGGGAGRLARLGGMTLDSQDRIVVCGWNLTSGASDIVPFVVRYLGATSTPSL